MNPDPSSRAKPRIDRSTHAFVESMALVGWTAAEIGRHLKASPALRGRRIPSQRQIQRIAARTQSAGRSGALGIKQLADAIEPTEGAAAVFESLGAAVRETAGKVTEISSRQASYVAAVRSAAPDCEPWVAFRLAQIYALREARSEPMKDLDLFVALAPWRSQRAMESYRDLVRAGRVPGPVFLAVDEIALVDDSGAEITADHRLLVTDLLGQPAVAEALAMQRERLRTAKDGGRDDDAAGDEAAGSQGDIG